MAALTAWASARGVEITRTVGADGLDRVGAPENGGGNTPPRAGGGVALQPALVPAAARSPPDPEDSAPAPGSDSPPEAGVASPPGVSDGLGLGLGDGLGEG